MLECLVIGDSIAVGISQFRKECVTFARTGWTSSKWNKQYLPTFNAQLPVKSLIISLGTNDYQGINTIAELNKIRENVKPGTRVFWVLPPRQSSRSARWFATWLKSGVTPGCRYLKPNWRATKFTQPKWVIAISLRSPPDAPECSLTFH